MSLSAVQFGVFVLTTSAGIMDHEEARRKKVGGKVSPSAGQPRASLQRQSCLTGLLKLGHVRHDQRSMLLHGACR